MTKYRKMKHKNIFVLLGRWCESGLNFPTRNRLFLIFYPFPVGSENCFSIIFPVMFILNFKILK